MNYIYQEPIMAIHFQDHFNMPLWLNNTSFALLPAGFLLGSFAFIVIDKGFKIKAHEKT